MHNSGVSARVRRIDGLEPAEGGTLSVALGGQGGAGEAFLQPYPYYCGRDVMILAAKSPMKVNEKLWWATCIKANRFRFGFGRQANRTLKDIVLPDPEDIPESVGQTDVDPFGGSEAAASQIHIALSNPQSWRRYKISDLFEIRKGKRLTKANMACGTVPFIGAIDSNNGVSAFVRDHIHKGNTITVNYNGSVAEAFYQPFPFWCSDDVNVLYPKFDLNPAIAMFMITVIRLERFRFNYGRKWHLDRMNASIIRLPATDDGCPAWQYMSDYIRSLPFSGVVVRPADVTKVITDVIALEVSVVSPETAASWEGDAS